MKRFAILISLLFSVFVSYSQANKQQGLAALYTVSSPATSGGEGDFIVSGFMNDPLGIYTVDSVEVGDIVWDASGHRFVIEEINSRSGNTISLDLTALTDDVPEFDTGVGCIQDETGMLPIVIIGGLSDIVRQSIDNHRRVVSRYDELQYPYMVGNKLYLTQSLVPIDFDTVGGGCIRTLTQASHGFSELEAIYFDGAEYVSMLGLYGDSQEPLFIVTDSIDANTFQVSAGCGIVDNDYGKPNGLYYWTDTGFNLNPDTTECPVAKIYDGKTLFMNLPCFEFDATNKDLLDIVTVTGQRTLLGGQVIPMFLDSIPVIDTICGTPVTTLAEYLIALEGCVTPVPDSLARSETVNGLDTVDHVAFYGTTGKLKGDAKFDYDPTNSRLRISTYGIGSAITTSTKNLILRNLTLGTVGLVQNPPMLEFEGNVWCTTPAASVVAKSYIGFGYVNGTQQGRGTFIVQVPAPYTSPGNGKRLISITPGSAGATTALMYLGDPGTVSATAGIGIGASFTLGGTGFPVAIGSEASASNGGYAIGNYTQSSHNNALMFGRLLVSSADNTSLVGVGLGIAERSTILAGSGLVNSGIIPQLRVMGLSSSGGPSWTASGDTITFASTITANINEGIELIGVSPTTYNFRTIIEVISSTVIRVNSAPGSASGNLSRRQGGDILQVGNGTDSYNSHLVINRNGLLGLGITTPTAKAHFQAGTGLVAPIRFTNGVQLTTPQSLTLEPATGGATLLFTDQGGTRRTLAYTSDITATNLTLTGSSQVIELTNSNGTDIVYKGVGVGLNKVSGTKDTLYLTRIEHWGEVAISGGSTSATTGTPELPDNDTPGTPTGNVSSEYTQTGSTITYTGAAGQAEITGSLNFTPTTGGDYLISIFQEGVEVAATKIRVTAVTATYLSVSLPKVNVTVATNDTFDLRIEPVSGSDTITVYRYTVYSRKIY